jgi:hypothetical protein
MSLPTPRGVSFSTKAAAALAVVSVTVAVWLSLQPHGLGDLHRVGMWTAEWVRGVDVYAAYGDVDYPPWAIVTLSPLGLVPSAVLPVLWVTVNIGALLFVARRLTKSTSTVFFLVIAAGTMRSLNQFSLVTLALAVAGTTRSTTTSPLWLGLALMKPQIGLVFWLHAVWRRQWQLACLSAVVPLVLTVAYAARVHVPVLSVPVAYLHSLHIQYDGVLWGQTEVTSWLRTQWPGASAVALAFVVAVLAFAPFARRWPQLGLALASLLSLRHLSYDLILLLAWLATLDGTALWLVTLALVADPSAVARLIAPESAIAHHADRVVLCALWAGGLVWAWRRAPVEPSGRISTK